MSTPGPVSEWVRRFCERHGLPLPEPETEHDEAGHVAPEPKLPPPHWAEREPGEDDE